VRELLKATAAVILAALTFGCGDKTVINGDIPVTPDYSSPAKVLETVELSFNELNVDYLKRSLSENFVFYTDPGEIGRPKPDGSQYRPPLSYSFTEFWNIAYNMFNAAYSVSLSISTGGVGEPDPEDTTFRADKVGLSLLVMVDENNGYIADKGYCHFEFEKYKNEKGQDSWWITKWWDDTEGGGEAPAGVERVPLWYILSLYERPT
jgi:hypothetical protein